MSANEINYQWDLTKEDFSLELDFFEEKDQEDKLWQARTELNTESLCGAIETIIFMQDKPITLQKIRSLIDDELPLRVVHESIARLQKEYEEKHHGIRLQEVAEGYQFRTKAVYSRFIQKMFSINALTLSPSALEVLAIIAYKGPVSKNGIEKIRGVDSSHIVRALMDKRLVSIQGRSEEVGRPSLFATTNEFLEVFNLNSLSDLPPEHELEEIAVTSHVQSIGNIKTVVQNDDKEKFHFDELAELDELSAAIKDIASDTNFIKDLKKEDRLAQKDSDHVRKSAFDILEEYVGTDATLKQNIEAANSETLTTSVEAKVVNLGELVHLDPDEERTLSEALDAAHSDLFGETLEDLSSEEGSELESLTEDLATKESNLAEAQEVLAEEAKKLDLDLNFLQEDVES